MHGVTPEPDHGTVDPGTAAAPAGNHELPLTGYRIVEAGRLAAGPSCATVLADWGAEVIKLEPPGGDPARGAGRLGTVNPRFALHNRSRRSLAVDLADPRGRAVAHRLMDTADVFVTNMRPTALSRLELDAPTLLARWPTLVYGQVSGWGLESDRADEASYDHGAFWAHAGLANTFADADGVPAQPSGGMGDRSAGAMLAGGVAAALLRRTRTGRGGHVTISLLATGAWMMGSELSDAICSSTFRRPRDRRKTSYPTLNCFPTSDGWLWLQMMFPERHWRALVAALDAPWLEDDPRFAGGDRTRLAAASEDLVDVLDDVFRTRSVADWDQRLRTAGVPVAPVRSVHDLVDDPVAAASGVFVDVATDGTDQRQVATPCRFEGSVAPDRTEAPQVGADSEELLAGLGFGPAEVECLVAEGICGSRD
jgi:crotonobetainyl-CoA:carnitine CoA-transferase CaiB-like acyl-CoA transferase